MLVPLFALQLALVAQPPQVVVVCPSDLQPGISEWQSLRTSQGWSVVITTPMAEPETTREKIRALAKPGDYVLLLGDSVLPQIAPNQPSKHTPAWYVPTPVSARFGSTDQSASDLPYADMDGDGLPDARVGRIPADSADELRFILSRSMAAEANTHYGEWRRQVNLVAGVGGFGFLADTAIETAAGGLIQSMLPSSLQTSVTYASPSSPFFPGYEQFRQLARKRFSQDALAWVYIGHGQITALDRVPRDGLPILTNAETHQLEKPQHAPPLALLLACYTGAFDAREDCLSENLLRAPGGPCVILSGARVTMPYGNSVLASGLMDAWFHQRAPYVGDLLLTARQQLLNDNDPRRPKLLDALAKVMSPTAEQLGQERSEHAALYNLFGDPTMKLQLPTDLEMNLVEKTSPGSEIHTEVVVTKPGRLITELCLPLSSVRGKKSSPNQATSESETDVCVVQRNVQNVSTGACQVTLNVPQDWEGFYVVRCFLEGEQECAMGSKTLRASKQ